MTYRGPFADERLGLGPFINCVAASGINVANPAQGGGIPTSDAEVTALRVATGDLTGSENLIDLNVGLHARYGFGGTLDESWETIQTGLVSGHKWFVVIGKYSVLPFHWRRWQPAGTFGHAVAVGPGDRSGEAWWVDPLAKDGPRGELIPMTTLRMFCASGQYQSLGIAENSHNPAKKYEVSVRKGITPYWLYTQAHGQWTRRLAFYSFTAASTARRLEAEVMGRNRYMAQLTTGLSNGALRGSWVELSDPSGTTGRITVKEA